MRARFGARRLACAAAIMVAHALIAALHAHLRGVSDQAGSAPRSLLGLEETLFGGLPKASLQAWVSPESGAATATAFAVWASLFYATALLSLYVALTRGLRDAAGLLAFEAVLVFSSDVAFALVPTRPPWMDADVDRVMADILGPVINTDTNPVAAAPSLHVAVPAAYAFWFVAHRLPHVRLGGALLVAWTLMMAVTVVYTGEHYVIDTVLGVAWAAVLFVMLRRIGLLYEHAPAEETAPVREPIDIRDHLPVTAVPVPAAAQRAA